MNTRVPSLRSFFTLIFATMPLINGMAVAKEPHVVISRKSVTSAPSTKVSADKPWQISLTVKENQQAAKPFGGLGSFSGKNLSESLPASSFTLNDTATTLFPTNFRPNALSTNSGPNHSAAHLPLPTLVPSQGFAGDILASGILSPLPQQPTIAGDTTGNGTIDFVDISAAMQLESTSVIPPLGGITK